MTAQQTTAASDANTRRSRASLGVLVLIVVAAGAILLLRPSAEDLWVALQQVQRLGPWGPVVFIVGYIVAVVALLPGSILTLAAGAIFGLLHAVLYVLVAAPLGATAAFLLARHVARNALERRLAGNRQFAAINRAVAAQGFRVVLLLRLSPLIPFTVLNYALGLTRISLRHYLLASIGMVPGTVLYAYYGQLVGDVAALAAGAEPDRGSEYYLFLVLGLAATILVTTFITRAARRALHEATQSQRDRPKVRSVPGERPPPA